MKKNHRSAVITERFGIDSIDVSVAEWHGLSLKNADIPVTLKLNGCSMQPLIRKQKDVLTVKPVYRPLKKGDIVLFVRRDGTYVVHRVRKIKNGEVLTIGDNCVSFDAPVPVSQVWGLAVSLERNGKTIQLDCAFSRARGRLRMATRPIRSLWRNLLRYGARTKRKLVGKNGQN